MKRCNDCGDIVINDHKCPLNPENKPTKECKHEELLGADYTEDCSVKLFGYRDKKGVTHITREEVSSPKIDSILKEADKEWLEKFPFREDKFYQRSLLKDIQNFTHSQIELAYNAGKDFKPYNVSQWKNYGVNYGYWDYFKEDVAITAKEQTIKQIDKWIDKYMEKTTRYYGTDKHGIDPEDLKKFINTL